MVWEKRVRFMSWVCFALMMGAILWFIIVSDDAESILDPRIVPFLVFLGLYAVFQVGAIYVDRLEKQNIRAKGIPAKATVLSLGETMTVVFNEPLMRIELEVQPAYEPRFTTTVEAVVPLSDQKKVQPGSRVRVMHIEGTTKVALAEIGQDFS